MATTILLLLVLSFTLLNAIKAAETPFPGYPSPWATPPSDTSDPSWAAAYAQAVAFVSNLTLTEKVNLTTGTGWEADRCIGNTGGVPRLGFRGMCLMDGPLGVRNSEFHPDRNGHLLLALSNFVRDERVLTAMALGPADHNSAFPAGINVAATFSRRLMRLRGEALGAEFRGKGVDVMLGPVSGPLGRVPQGGRNWEGFG